MIATKFNSQIDICGLVFAYAVIIAPGVKIQILGMPRTCMHMQGESKVHMAIQELTIS